VTVKVGIDAIVPLAHARDDRVVGGKAVGLQRLIQLDVAVPRGFVITAPAVARFHNDTIPTDLWQEIVRARGSLDAGVLIVRSSAIGEDSQEASFAGQLDSIGAVIDDESLRRALLRCAASRSGSRVVAYERSRGHRLGGLAIVVQEQIASAISGVVFAEDPTTGRDVLIEYCEGSGDALVSGQVNPGRLSVSDTDQVVELAQLSCHWGQTPIGAGRGSNWGQTPSGGAREVNWGQTPVRELARQARRISAVLDAPQDIEWTIDADGRCWFLQSRPMTTRSAPRETDAPVLWSNANVNENFPDRISPLLYSVASAGYYHYFRNLGRAFGLSRRRLDAIEDPLRHIIGVHGARMYYNLTSIHTVLRAAPFGEHLADAFNQFVGATELAPRPRSSRPWALVGDAFETVRIAASVAWQYSSLTSGVVRFERAADEFAAITRPSLLPRLEPSALRDRLRAFMDIRCNRWKDASLADAASMVCYAALKGFLQKRLPGEDQEALHNTLLKALPDLVSGRPPVELWKMSRTIRSTPGLATLFRSESPEAIVAAIRSRPDLDAFRRALDEYLDAWGFRCSAELMLTSPSFQEDPAALVPLLRAYAQSDADSPEAQLARQREERLRATSRVVRRLGPVNGLALRMLLAWTQRAIQLRERARLKQALLYSRLRRIALAIGDHLVADGRIDRRDEVFMLTVDEIDALLAGACMFPDEVRATTTLRRRAHERFAGVRPPDTMRLPRGAYFAPDHKRSPSAPSADDRLTGTSACGGRSTGRAVVLAGVAEAHRLEPGDILVARQTDPGWAPVFPLISGLVVERGGMLSHGAIIAREFGIPSVVGVADATRRIRSGAMVCLDGDAGTVRIISDPSSRIDSVTAMQEAV
jgi:pyruvate,water dikinase